MSVPKEVVTVFICNAAIDHPRYLRDHLLTNKNPRTVGTWGKASHHQFSPHVVAQSRPRIMDYGYL